MNILQITVILVVSTGFGDDLFYWGGGGWSLPLCISNSTIFANIVVCSYKCNALLDH